MSAIASGRFTSFIEYLLGENQGGPNNEAMALHSVRDRHSVLA